MIKNLLPICGTVLIMSLLWACGEKDKNQEASAKENQSAVTVLNSPEQSQTVASYNDQSANTISSSDQTTATQPQPADGKFPVITFEKTTHNFGKVKAGEKVKYNFKFKNTGDAPLIVSAVKPSCGCTVSDWTKTPVPPGGSGSVTLEFDTSGKQGLQSKSATVESNTKGGAAIALTFTAEVIELANSPQK